MLDELLGYPELFQSLRDAGRATLANESTSECRRKLSASYNSDFSRWRTAIESLNCGEPTSRHWKEAVVQAANDSLSPEDQQQNREALRILMPWRKGPFNLGGVCIDTEWRSDLKWDRIAACVDWRDQTVLDVGCGNGYFGWRMLGAGARFVLGLDPFVLYVMQHAAIRKFMGRAPNYVIPVGDEVLTKPMRHFDIVMSLGVLYHRSSPIDHLVALGRALRPGGQLILETLTISDENLTTLVPADRYAKMRNVWFVPSVAMLVRWLDRCGYRDIQHVDTTRTTKDEQRATDWMTYESLSDFLDPTDPTKTIEGYPAPARTTMIAHRD